MGEFVIKILILCPFFFVASKGATFYTKVLVEKHPRLRSWNLLIEFLFMSILIFVVIYGASAFISGPQDY